MTSKISRLLPSPKPQFLSLISIRRIFERAQVSCEKTENWIICDWYKQVYKILAVMWNGTHLHSVVSNEYNYGGCAKKTEQRK